MTTSQAASTQIIKGNTNNFCLPCSIIKSSICLSEKQENIMSFWLWAELVVRTFSDVFSESMSCFFCVKMMLKTAWERLLVSFMLVAATVLKKGKKYWLGAYYWLVHYLLHPLFVTAPDLFIHTSFICISSPSITTLHNHKESVTIIQSRSVTWPCFQSPSGPGCRCTRWQLVWTDLQRRVPSEGALWHAGFLCSWDSAGHAHAHSRSPCNSPGGGKEPVVL